MYKVQKAGTVQVCRTSYHGDAPQDGVNQMNPEGASPPQTLLPCSTGHRSELKLSLTLVFVFTLHITELKQAEQQRLILTSVMREAFRSS